MSDTLKGTVKWFNDAKGFGFIEHTSGRDVFVHYSVIDCEGFKTLKDGDQVEYEIKEGPKGLHAVRVGKPAGAMADGSVTEAAAAPAGETSATPPSDSSSDDSDSDNNSSGSSSTGESSSAS